MSTGLASHRPTGLLVALGVMRLMPPPRSAVALVSCYRGCRSAARGVAVRFVAAAVTDAPSCPRAGRSRTRAAVRGQTGAASVGGTVRAIPAVCRDPKSGALPCTDPHVSADPASRQRIEPSAAGEAREVAVVARHGHPMFDGKGGELCIPNEIPGDSIARSSPRMTAVASPAGGIHTRGWPSQSWTNPHAVVPSSGIGGHSRVGSNS